MNTWEPLQRSSESYEGSSSEQYSGSFSETIASPIAASAADSSLDNR